MHNHDLVVRSMFGPSQARLLTGSSHFSQDSSTPITNLWAVLAKIHPRKVHPRVQAEVCLAADLPVPPGNALVCEWRGPDRKVPPLGAHGTDSFHAVGFGAFRFEADPNKLQRKNDQRVS